MNEIFPIIVLFNQKIEETLTFSTLLRVLENSKEDIKKHIKNVIIVDNSTDNFICEHNKNYMDNYNVFKNQLCFVYIGGRINRGLARAYNIALNLVDSYRFPKAWLLLLDQDSSLTIELFETFVNYVKEKPNDNVGIVLPRIICNNKLISPLRVGKNLYDFSECDYGINGLITSRYTGINSCTFIKIEALKSIKEFDEAFPIDYLDHITFFKLKGRGYNIFVLDTNITHQLSFLDFTSVPINRYLIYLEARLNFIKEVTMSKKQKLRAFIYDFIFIHCKRTLANKKYEHFKKGNMIFLKEIKNLLR